LGGRVTAAAVEIALGLPLRPIVLRTDDYRIPAIKVYLKLGFVPTYDHLSYPDRWQAIFLALGENYARYHSALQQGATQ
jgi:mycothiol synthase